MKKILIISIIIIVGNCLYGQTLKIVYGDRIYYQFKDKLIEIKKFQSGSSLRGYDVIDSTNIFLAYDPEKSAEASTIISVFSVDRNKEKIIGELGGTGDSFFVYNTQNDLIIFNDSDGIEFFKLHDNEGNLINKLEPKLLLEKEQCYLPFWVDSSTFGYQHYIYDQPFLEIVCLKNLIKK